MAAESGGRVVVRCLLCTRFVFVNVRQDIEFEEELLLHWAFLLLGDGANA